MRSGWSGVPHCGGSSGRTSTCLSPSGTPPHSGPTRTPAPPQWADQLQEEGSEGLCLGMRGHQCGFVYLCDVKSGCSLWGKKGENLIWEGEKGMYLGVAL